MSALSYHLHLRAVGDLTFRHVLLRYQYILPIMPPQLQTDVTAFVSWTSFSCIAEYMRFSSFSLTTWQLVQEDSSVQYPLSKVRFARLNHIFRLRT